MKVAEVLALPELRRGLPETLTGHDNLDRDVRWVHAGEVHNIATLLRGGEVLLTTGMGVGKSSQEQRRYITELSNRGVAAVVIELGTSIGPDIPRALVAEAARRQLPLVVLRAAVPFVAVTEAVHTAIVNAHHAALQRAEALAARFTNVTLEGGGVPGVLSVLAEAIGNPVILERGDGGLNFVATPPLTPADVDPVTVWSQARGQEPVGTTVDVPGASGGRLLTVPMLTPPDQFTLLALKHAAGAVALAFLRSRQEDEVLAFGRGDLLAGFADGRIAPETAQARAGAMGFPARTTLLAVAARVWQGSWRVALREAERELSGLGVPALVGLRPGVEDLLVVLGLHDAVDRIAISDAAAGVLAAIAERRELPPPVVVIGPLSSWTDAGEALRDALEGLPPTETLPAKPWHDSTKMPLERLLWQLADRAEVTRFADRLLGRVIAHDSAQRHRLLPTLEALCAAGGHRAEAARALHINRQAVYDRLARLERLVDVDLRDPRAILALHLAVQVHHRRG